MLYSKGKKEDDDSCPKWLVVPSFNYLIFFLNQHGFEASLLCKHVYTNHPGGSGCSKRAWLVRNEPQVQTPDSRVLSNPAPEQQMETHELWGCSHT